MTPQSSFMVVAPVDPRRDADLRRLLASMNAGPGQFDPANGLIPFADFGTLHFARLLVIDDTTQEDIRALGLPPRNHPSYLAFLGDVDGDGDAFLREAGARAEPGLRQLFSCCTGFAADADLYEWMKRHSTPPAANYVNTRGRTVKKAREDAALSAALERHLDANAQDFAGLPPREVHARLRAFAEAETSAGRLTLTPEQPAPLGWSVANAVHLIGLPLLLLVLSPVLIVVGALVVLRVRSLEKRDLELCQRVDRAHTNALAAIEDLDVTNQFSALGAVKPGRARRWTLSFVLLVIDYLARHVYTRGRLARVRTIHFARWVWLDGHQRVIFLSNYDASLEGYMDDFINKAGFGLNIAFSNGVGYPRTRWLVLDGCSDERKFKDYLRRHQLPTQVWYKAYPGLTAVDLERNALIRKGIEAGVVSDAEARAWVALL